MDLNRNEDNNMELQILNQANIGLDSGIRHSVVETLSNTLANEAGLTQKNHKTHWNVNRAGFCEQDTLFESQFKPLDKISDETGERVQIPGRLPRSSVDGFRIIPRLNEKPWDIADIIDLESAIRYLRDDAINHLKEKNDGVNATSWRKSKA